jgi:NADH-quinone oxidoreductase subunit C
MIPAILGIDDVSAAHPENAAIVALQRDLPGAITDARFDRSELTLTIAREHIRAAAAVVQKSGYNFLEDVTCVDWLPAKERFQVTYHILSHALKQRIRLIAFVEEADLEIASITEVWPSANFYEREVFDLFGVRFGGHPNMRRIMMPDEWQGHPLRKDYPVEGYR